MRKTWAVHDAKARFSEFLEASLKDGPQVITRRGVETAVLVPIDQWRRLEQDQKPTLKNLLLASDSRTERLTPQRAKHRVRIPPALD